MKLRSIPPTFRLQDREKQQGNFVAEAYFAALAIEHGCEWISTDHDFARFPGLKSGHPLGHGDVGVFIKP